MNDFTSPSKINTKNTKDRFSLAVEGSNDGLWDWNLETNEVFYSLRWKNMLGYQDEEIENNISSWGRLVHPDDKENVLDQAAQYISGKIQHFDIEMRMLHKEGYNIFVLSRALLVRDSVTNKAIRLVGTYLDISEQKKIKEFDDKNNEILKMIATGESASKVYDAIALMYEGRHDGMRCSLLELEDGVLLHGGAPSMPKAYCEAVHGLKNGPEVGSCGSSTYHAKRVLVEDIATDPKWSEIKGAALPHGMRSCWSEPIIDSTGKVLGAFGMYYDYPSLPNEEESKDLISAARLAGIVMERDQNQKRIHQLAYTDELTGLSSRAFFHQNLENTIHISERNNRRFALLYIDLDDFKSVNDSLGHDAGDIFLKEIASRLKSVIREADYAARIGGDEFCLLINEIDDDMMVVDVAKRSLEKVLQPVDIFGRSYKSGCSIGIAYYPNDGKDFTSLIKAADRSLYFAKENGKNQYAFYKHEYAKKAEQYFRLEQSLRKAIDKEELTLVYQPQIHIETGKVIGFEALSRWSHKGLGNVSPMEFIPMIEKIGMMKKFTHWVLRTACQQAIEWRKFGISNLRISVNISPKHFLDTSIITLVKSVLDETGLEPSLLELEVTEDVIQTSEKNLSIFNKLKELGVGIAIDDFGSGYSSFASLKHIDVDCLKIDKYFIQDMMTDKKSKLLLKSMIEMGHALEYGIIAEGVEKSEQVEELKNLGCKVIQGYFFSKPINADKTLDYLQKN